MKKIFIVAGEVSGDTTGAWYLNKLKKENNNIQVEAVGGKFLDVAGAKLYERLEKLNVSGVVEILRSLRFILKFIKQLADYILQNNFDEVVLVDFPGFNLRLAKRLKKSNPELKITYLSPPQLWIWGEGRIKTLKKHCDRLIVLYPFEVEWYKERGVEAEFLGNPICDKLKGYMQQPQQRENCIAIMPASRMTEMEKLLPFFADVVRRFKLIYPKVKVILPVAESFSKSWLENKLRKVGLFEWSRDVEIIQDEQEKLRALSKCCLAITKPGSVSLELALMGIPAVALYKASWISYLLAKMLVNIKHMCLPNLLLGKEVYKEFIQGDCKSELIFKHASDLYKSFLNNGQEYKHVQQELSQIKKMLCDVK